MTVSVTFAGTTYNVPEEDDSGWADLTDYLVALSDAQVGTSDKKGFRISTSDPVTVSATDDYAVGVSGTGGTQVDLPAGSTGQVFVIFDAAGNAASSNITVSGTSGQLINGRSTYVIRPNYGAVTVQFGTSEWSVLSAREVTQEQNTTNLSMIDASVAVDNTGVSVTNLHYCTFDFTGPVCEFIVSWGDAAMRCACSKNSNTVDCLWDTDEKFLSANAGTGVAVTKSSSTITVRNRLGTSATFKIKAIVGQITAATAWGP